MLRIRPVSCAAASETVERVKISTSRIIADVHRLGPAFAVCEVPEDDALQALKIRVAHVSTDGRFTDSALRRMAERFEHKGDFDVVESRIEIL